VAPGVRLWAVKVLGGDGSGSTSGIIAGIDWVVQQGTIEVLNMSLGGSGVSSVYKTAIDSALAAGVVSVVAAGNSNADANNYSPAFVPSAVTVSAITDSDGLPGGLGDSRCRSTLDDTKADYRNWGSAVDIAAPGSCILSTYPIEQGSYAAINGTSMASPHVAGAAAVLASNGLSASQITGTLTSCGNFNWVDTSPDGILEPLLDVSSFSPTMVGGEPPQNQTPIASFSSSCTDLSCSFDASNSTDPDGSIVTYDWDFGDGSLQSGEAVSYTFNSAGDYEVILTVRDNEGAENSVSQTVTVTEGQEPPPPPPETNLVSSAVNNGSTWTAIVETADRSALSGSWSTGDSCSAASGVCSLSGIRKKEASVVFVSEAGDQVTVFKP
jgi:subtilisin family serine protease